MRISLLATRLAEGIVKEVPEFSDRIGRIRHTLAFLLNVVPITVLTILVGIVTDQLIEVMTALLAFGILRQASGGIHFKTSEMCILITTVGTTIVSFASFSTIVLNIMTVLSLLLVLIYAPSRIKGRTLFPEKFFKYLRYIAALIVLANFFIQSSVIAAAFLVQSLMLVRLKGGEGE